MEDKFSSLVIGKVVEAMRPQMEEMIREQRGNVDKNLEQLIESTAQKFDDNIRAIQQQQQLEKEATAKKVAELQECVGKLNALVQEL